MISNLCTCALVVHVTRTDDTAWPAVNQRLCTASVNSSTKLIGTVLFLWLVFQCACTNAATATAYNNPSCCGRQHEGLFKVITAVLVRRQVVWDVTASRPLNNDASQEFAVSIFSVGREERQWALLKGLLLFPYLHGVISLKTWIYILFCFLKPTAWVLGLKNWQNKRHN
jgi:hypothetical protein